jgi:hypothetical protein
MKAASTKEAAKKGRPEERPATAGTFPVGQPGSKEEVNDKGESEDKSGNENQDSHLDHGQDEERKHDQPQPAIRTPGIGIFRIHPGSVALI